uniref:Uncharacterized protein n=1 Tax=Rhizophora mucronata TaxID=61149 RepID=A0A2P2PUC2_RHIMU
MDFETRSLALYVNYTFL